MTMVQRQELQRDSSLRDLTYKRSHWERGQYMFKDGKRTPPATGRFRLFVYGTLKSGYGNHRILDGQGAMFLANSSLKGFIMFSCGGYYPTICKAPSPDWVIRGELYEIEQSQLDACDRLEGVANGHYQRIEVDLEEGDGKAFTYIQPAERWLRDGSLFYPSGVWSPNSKCYHWKEGTEHAHALLKETESPHLLKSLPGPRPPTAPVPSSHSPIAPQEKPKPEIQVGPGVEEAAPDAEVA